MYYYRLSVLQKNKEGFYRTSNTFINSKRIVNIKHKHNYFYYLDCRAGEGLVNPLFKELKKIPSSKEFNYYINFFLKKCININRSFSNAVEFLSIWLEKSPYTLLESLKSARLKQYFNRTQYSYEGDQWYFPKLLKTFAVLVSRAHTASKILDYVFENFDFFSIPDIFLVEVIGYDRLQKCIEECPPIFKQALVLKMNRFLKLNKTMNLGLQSQKYLNEELKKVQNSLTISEGLILNSGTFASPVKTYRCSKKSLTHESNYFR